MTSGSPLAMPPDWAKLQAVLRMLARLRQATPEDREGYEDTAALACLFAGYPFTNISALLDSFVEQKEAAE